MGFPWVPLPEGTRCAGVRPPRDRSGSTHVRSRAATRRPTIATRANSGCAFQAARTWARAASIGSVTLDTCLRRGLALGRTAPAAPCSRPSSRFRRLLVRSSLAFWFAAGSPSGPLQGRGKILAFLNPGLKVASPAGLEPATPGLGNRCSILLSYGDVSVLLKKAISARVSQVQNGELSLSAPVPRHRASAPRLHIARTHDVIPLEHRSREAPVICRTTRSGRPQVARPDLDRIGTSRTKD
jgi:hypothetical protein